MSTVAEAIKRVKWASKQHVAVAIWTEEDVISRAQGRGIKITQEQAQEIIDEIDSEQDCTIGITWDTIDCYLDELPDSPCRGDIEEPTAEQCAACKFYQDNAENSDVACQGKPAR